MTLILHINYRPFVVICLVLTSNILVRVMAMDPSRHTAFYLFIDIGYNSQ